MKRNGLYKTALAGCLLLLLTGCGASAKSSDAARGNEQSEASGYITVAQAKAAALENAGLSEENVQFVRVYLDAAQEEDARYELEFVSQDAVYDYAVDAVTGALVSMNCENAAYNIEAVPTEVIQAADGQDAPVQSGGVQDGGQGTAAPVQSGSAGAQSGADGQYIGADAAKQAALEHAGLQEGAVRFTHAHLELDDGCWQYDVEFHKGDAEYDYSIDALTGEVRSYDYDAEYFQTGAEKNSGSNVPGEVLTSEAAVQIALEYAGVAQADAQRLKAEFDYDDGRAEYEIEWKVGTTEYACDVDAHTGEVLSFEKEF